MEARELALKKAVEEQYTDIINHIVSESKQGHLECFIYYIISDETRRLLTEDGYSVGKTQFERNESLTKIEW